MPRPAPPAPAVPPWSAVDAACRHAGARLPDMVIVSPFSQDGRATSLRCLSVKRRFPSRSVDGWRRPHGRGGLHIKIALAALADLRNGLMPSVVNTRLQKTRVAAPASGWCGGPRIGGPQRRRIPCPASSAARLEARPGAQPQFGQRSRLCGGSASGDRALHRHVHEPCPGHERREHPRPDPRVEERAGAIRHYAAKQRPGSNV